MILILCTDWQLLSLLYLNKGNVVLMLTNRRFVDDGCCLQFCFNQMQGSFARMKTARFVIPWTIVVLFWTTILWRLPISTCWTGSRRSRFRQDVELEADMMLRNTGSAVASALAVDYLVVLNYSGGYLVSGYILIPDPSIPSPRGGNL